LSNIAELKKVPEISFIDNLTIDDLQNQLIEDYQDKYKELTGESRDLPLADPVRLVLYSAALMGYQAMQYIDRAGKSDLLKYTYGSYLDNIAALKGLFRRDAVGAKTTLRFTVSAVRTATTAIPGGSRVTDEKGNTFATDEYAEIPGGAEYVDVRATALQTGLTANGLPEGTLNLFVDPIPYVKSVVNIEETSGGDAQENDDDLTYRVLMHPHSYSVAGPKEAYEYWARTFRTDIDDVMVYTPAPTEVTVLFMLEGGVAPSDIICDELAEFLSSAAIRPLTDVVHVAAPYDSDYHIDVTYYINRSDASNAVDIQLAVEKAVEDYKNWQRRIGRDVNPSELIKRIIAAGAKRVELYAPTFVPLEATAIANCTDSSVAYGGLEDD
jgi:phage-related baseplate assembly protein